MPHNKILCLELFGISIICINKSLFIRFLQPPRTLFTNRYVSCWFSAPLNKFKHCWLICPCNNSIAWHKNTNCMRGSMNMNLNFSIALIAKYSYHRHSDTCFQMGNFNFPVDKHSSKYHETSIHPHCITLLWQQHWCFRVLSTDYLRIGEYLRLYMVCIYAYLSDLQKFLELIIIK